MDEDITTIKNCPSFEKIRTFLLNKPKFLNAIIKNDLEIDVSIIEKYDKELGEYAKIAIDVLKVFTKLIKISEEKMKKDFLYNPEAVLLYALAEDFKEYGLFMVDTFEKIKDIKIISKIHFKDNGEVSKRFEKRDYSIKDYI